MSLWKTRLKNVPTKGDVMPCKKGSQVTRLILQWKAETSFKAVSEDTQRAICFTWSNSTETPYKCWWVLPLPTKKFGYLLGKLLTKPLKLNYKPNYENLGKDRKLKTRQMRFKSTGKEPNSCSLSALSQKCGEECM